MTPPNEPTPDVEAPTLTAGQGGSPGHVYVQARVAHVGLEALLRGAQVGRYVVLDRIGAGGMGVVYKAYDPDLNRVVAVKVLLLAHSTSDYGRDRLLREAQALARLQHPNVVAVHDVGMIAGQVFVAMEFIEGETLQVWAELAHPGQTEILRVFVEAGRGLAAAHDAGIVHRDFKPANVLRSSDGRVRVVDFGLARAADDATPAPDPDAAKDTPPLPPRAVSSLPFASATTEPAAPSGGLGTPLTRTGAVMGTPAYMAPEQRHGRAADARADQFAFSVSLYEAIYRQRPDVEAIERTGRLATPPAQARGHRVSTRLRRVLQRGLERHAADRFESMGALLAALEGATRARRRRVLAAALVLVAAAVLVATVAGVGRSRAATPCQHMEARLAEAWNPTMRGHLGKSFAGTGRAYAADAWQRTAGVVDAYAGKWVDLRRQICEDTQVRRSQSVARMDLEMTCLDRRLAELNQLLRLYAVADDTVVGGALDAAYALVPAESCLDPEGLESSVVMPAQPAQRAGLAQERERLADAKARLDAGKYNDGLAIARDVVAAATALGYTPVLAEASWVQGRLLERLDRFAEADESLGRARLLAEESGLDALRFRATLALYALDGGRMQRPDAAARLEGEASALLRRLGPDDGRTGDLLAARVEVNIQLGHYKQAETLALEGLAVRRRSLPAQHPDIARAQLAVGRALHKERLLTQAMPYLDEALRSAQVALGPQHPELAAYINERAATLNVLDRRDEAEAELRRALALLEASYGPEHTQIAITLNELANVLRRSNRHDETIATYERAIRIAERRLGPEHAFTGLLESNLSSALAKAGRLDEAEAMGQKGLAILRAALGDAHEDVAWAWIALAMIAQERESWELAASRYAQACAGIEAVLGADSPELVYPMHRMANSIDNIDSKRALPVYERVLAITEKNPQSERDHAWAQWHTGLTLITLGKDIERGETLVRAARATFVAHEWDPDEVLLIDRALVLAARKRRASPVGGRP